METDMYATYRLRIDELDSRFLETLKQTFRDREIEITVCEADAGDEDETAYLLRSPANRARLLEAIENVARQKDLVTIESDDLP